MGSNWDLSAPNSIESLQIVYKLVERCNLNCSYCYYFNMGDGTAMLRPARASLETATALARWLAAGCAELGIPIVRIAFHGGEPMMSQARHFDRACQIFREELGGQATVEFSIQTNGTILSEAWLDAFKKHRVSVGVSIDGNKADHDRFRLDHRGRSSFGKTERNIRRLVEESAAHPFLQPSTISVLNAGVDYASTYRYFRSLGVRYMHFLLPDRNADDSSPQVDAEARRIGHGLLEMFEEWLAEDDPSVQVRVFSELLGFFETGSPLGPASRRRKSNQVLVARSDATVAIDDTFIPALGWYSSVPDFRIADVDLRGVLGDRVFAAIEHESLSLPEACENCQWRGICRGGDLENRFSTKNGFNNRSVYCEAYKALLPGICRTLAENGYPVMELERKFGAMCHV